MRTIKQEEATKRWRTEHPEKLKEYRHKDYLKRYANPASKKKILEENRAWKKANREVVARHTKEWIKRNPEKARELRRKQYLKDPQKHYAYTYAYAKNKRKTDVQFRLSLNLRNRLNKALKKQGGTGSGVRDLGCSVPELRQHLEGLFQEGMSWENWSRYGWHIDHIRPLCTFDLTDYEQVKIACHFSNLQPLWAEENLRKSKSFTLQVPSKIQST
jgi:hypothetical protein